MLMLARKWEVVKVITKQFDLTCILRGWKMETEV